MLLWRLCLLGGCSLCSCYVPLNMRESRHASRGLSLLATHRHLLVKGNSFQPDTKENAKETVSGIAVREKLALTMLWHQYPSIVCVGSLVVAAVFLLYRCYGPLVRWWIKSKHNFWPPRQLHVKHTNCIDQVLYVEDGRAFGDLDEWYDSNTGTEGELGAEATPEFSFSGRRGAICHSLDPELNDVDARLREVAAARLRVLGASLQVAAARRGEKQPCCQSRGPTVTFALTLNSHHEVTPYAEVYGTHPNNFDFDKRVEPPSWCFVGDAHSDSDGDDYEETVATETHSTPSCRQMTVTNAGELVSTCPWELPKADHGRNHDAEQDALDDEQDTQSPDSSEVNSDGSADSNMGDEDECGHGRLCVVKS